MSDIDCSSLDGRSLQVFLSVLDEGSVTRAARRIGVSQSAVSHTLQKLRVVLADPLFVRSGQGIVPTERALHLRRPIQGIVDAMKRLGEERAFDPKAEELEFRVAANDFQRELFFPPLLRKCREIGVSLRLVFLPSSVPDAALLQGGNCDLVITPFPPDTTDVLQVTLFEDEMACFFDADERDAPRTFEEFVESDHIEVRFPDHTSATTALRGIDASKLWRPTIAVPSFGAIAPFMRGTTLITAQLSTMQLTSLRGFGVAPLPFENPPLKLAMAWHRRNHNDPAQRWLRAQIREIASSLR